MIITRRQRHLIGKCTTILTSIGILLSCPVFTLTTTAKPAEESHWTLLETSSDEFEGTELDTSKWTNGIWYDTSSDLAFNSENVSVSAGNLVLTARKENYNGKAYTIGSVESKFDVPGTDSYVEVRAKALDSKANVLSAIWLQSSPLTSALNPNPEIDIMETFDFSKMTSTIHIWKQSPNIHLQLGKNNWNTGVSDISNDYHTYGLERRNGKMRFYFDRQLVWEKTSSYDSFVELSRHMVLSLEGHLGAPAQAYLPSEFLVDYVRTYYYSDFSGIPDNGTYKIVNRHSGKVLNVPESSLNDATQLTQSTYSGGDNEKWNLTKNPDNTYFIQNVLSNKCVDLTADSGVTSNGTSITQYTYHGDSNQRWYLVPTDNGYFRIISALSGKALCVKDASTADNAKIIQWTYENDDTNDEWIFITP